MADPVICGTTEYMPPEVVMKAKHDKSADIWSLGIILYVPLLSLTTQYLLHGDIPFKGST